MANKELTITRTLNAPRQTVWRAWTDQDQIKEWWGPRGVTNPTCIWEAKPGGRISIVMLAGSELGPLAGQEWPMTGEFKEVSPHHRIVFTANALRDGRPILEHLTTVTFEDQNSQTIMTVHIEVIKATPEAEGPLAGMEQGWNQQLDKLTERMEG